MNIIFSINGGAGKVVMGTAVCKAIKKKYPNDKLIVISGYPDLLINNPNVDKSFAFGALSYFYEDYIENKDFIVIAHDPYVETSFLYQKTHLIQVWCEMNDIPYDGEMPEIFLTKREIEHYQKNLIADKPILLLQTNGGADPNLKYSWARDMPSSTILEIIDYYKNSHIIAHVKREDQPKYDNTVPMTASFRELCALALVSEKRLLIDSFIQHACAAFNLPSVVLWIANSPVVFGYPMHKNIQANDFPNKPDTRNAFLTKFNIGGEPFEFPYNDEREIFNTETIIKALEGYEDEVKSEVVSSTLSIVNENIIGD
jgi:hypothetical protein